MYDKNVVPVHLLTDNHTPIARRPPAKSPASYCHSVPAPQSDSAKRLPRDLARRRHLGHAPGARDIVQRGADQRGGLFFKGDFQIGRDHFRAVGTGGSVTDGGIQSALPSRSKIANFRQKLAVSGINMLRFAGFSQQFCTILPDRYFGTTRDKDNPGVPSRNNQN